MSGFSNPIIGGGGSLVYPSIHSPDYAAGSAGWSIGKDGSAQFSALDLIGKLISGASIEDGTIPAAAVAFTARDVGGITTTIAATAPASPQTGDLWINTSAGNQIRQWDGAAWTAIYWNAGYTLQSGSITAAEIAAGTITASLLAAGIVVAGIVNGTTITGALIETATSGARVTLDNTGTLNVYNSSGTLVMSMSASGETLTVGPSGAIQAQLSAVPGYGILEFLLPGTWGSLPEILGFVKAGTSGNYAGVAINGPSRDLAGHTDWVGVGFNSSDSASSANLAFNYVDANAASHGQCVLDYGGFRILAGSAVAVKPGTGTSSTNAAYPEAWNSLTLTSGWTGNLNYRVLPDGNLQISAAMTPGTTANGTVIGTLPSGWIPSGNRRIAVSADGAPAANGTPYLYIGTSGGITVHWITTSMTGVFCEGVVRMA